MGENLFCQLKKTAIDKGNNVAYHYLGKEKSYAQLFCDVKHCAGALARRSIGKGDKIALVLANSEEYIIAYYAISSLGAVVVPINPTFTISEISFILENAQVKGVVAVQAIVEKLLERAKQVPFLNELKIIPTSPVATLKTIWDLITEAKEPSKWPEIHEDDEAIILYTAGTTGKPKGVVLSHLNLLSNARQIGEQVNFGSDDTILCALPLFHVFSMTLCMNMPIMFGTKIVIHSRFSPQDAVKAISEQGIKVFSGVPTMYNLLLNLPDIAKADFTSLKYCISGGAALTHSIYHQFQKLFGIGIIEGYGLSEASPVCSINRVEQQKPGSIGVPLPSVMMKIVDEEGLELPENQIGEIVVRGPNIMKGYYNNLEATREIIRDGWLNTGDLGYRDVDGNYYIVDRKKDLIIVGGLNVYPREVEDALLQHPQVEEAVVIGVQDEVYGEKIRAIIKLKEGQSNSVEEIKNFCSENLAKYKIPKEVRFVYEIPKNTIGKVMRHLLRSE